ncbi:SDR family NAD(P)-dependent oxidoreductase [Salibacterium sp. K-3]
MPPRLIGGQDFRTYRLYNGKIADIQVAAADAIYQPGSGERLFIFDPVPPLLEDGVKINPISDIISPALTVDDYQQMINVNQFGIFLGMQTVIPYMEKQQKGSIVNNVSVSAFAPISQSSAYAATKASVVAMSKAAAVELGKKGIRVNMIHPGGIETDMATEGKGVPESYQSVPLGRIGQPEEIARAAAFLASDESSYCTGAEIVVDGGMTLGSG